MKKIQKALDYDSVKWEELFFYDTTSPSHLSWKVERFSLGGKKRETWYGKYAGNLAKVKNKENRAWRVGATIDGVSKLYTVHRIIACLHGHKVNGKIIDHRNGVTADNFIDNIRVTNHKVNAQNKGLSCNSPYGIHGVGFYEDKNQNSYFISRTTVGGKRKQTSYPIKALGVMEAFKQACLCRQRDIVSANTSGEHYTDRHTPVHESHDIFKEKTEYKKDYAKHFRNQKLRTTNSSGVVGVSFQTKVSNKPQLLTIVAHWSTLEGKQCTKCFSCHKLGIMVAFRDAVIYRRKMIQELNAQGAGYTENHGK